MTLASSKIAVIGAGAWGTALAHVQAAAGKNVSLYARDKGLADEVNRFRENKKYIPGAVLASGITADIDPAAVLKGAGVVLLVAPVQHTRATLQLIAPHLGKDACLVSCSKGIEIGTGKRISQIAAEETPGHPFAVLSGPTFASEVVQNLPAAVTLASSDKNLQDLAQVLRTPLFRPYLSQDVAGVEIAGAVKNVIAIACGIVAGRKLGQNAHAAVMTRGIAEIRRFGFARGALPETFLGLAGIGDLSLTCHFMTSRNFSLGAALGRGEKLDDILGARNSVAEGVTTARALLDDPADMPICKGVGAILHGGATIDDVIHGLLTRDIRNESE